MRITTTTILIVKSLPKTRLTPMNTKLQMNLGDPVLFPYLYMFEHVPILHQKSRTMNHAGHSWYCISNDVMTCANHSLYVVWWGCKRAMTSWHVSIKIPSQMTSWHVSIIVFTLYSEGVEEQWRHDVSIHIPSHMTSWHVSIIVFT